MNFSLPANEDQTRIKVVKKEELAARKEAKKSFFAAAPTATAGTNPASAESARSGTPPVNPGSPAPTPGIPGSSANNVGTPAKKADPKVQLVEVEPGIYDIYFTCACCQQYVIRCESLDKAAAAPIHAS